MISGAPTSVDDVEARVLRVVGAALDDRAGSIGKTTPLVELSGFDSIVLVEIVDSIEREFEIELDVEDLVPETFESVGVLARTIWPRVATQEGR